MNNALLDIKSRDTERLAIKDSYGTSVRYGDLVKLSEQISSATRKRSVTAVLTSNDAGAAAWVIALIMSGNVPLILSANTEPGLLQKLLDTYRPQYICSKTNCGCEKGEPTLHCHGYNLLATGETPYEVHRDLSHLLPTSGSTGSPKLVRHKYENIEASALNISTFFRLTEDDRALMVLPLHYTMGLSIVFSHLKAGATVLITDRSITEPEFWKFLKEEEATSFTGVPFSYEILDRLRFTRMRLPHLTLLTQGGGKMPEALNLKFAEYCIANGKRWVATYGMSEGTARMAWLPEEYSLAKAGSIGIAVPNGRLSLRNEEGIEIEESPAMGELCYEGGNVTMGYALSITDLEKGDERNGFLATGDIARRDADGFYYIVGRKGRFLKLYGNRVGLDDCENILRNALNGEIACTGTDNCLISYVTEEKEVEKTKHILMESLHLPANCIEVRYIASIPKSEAGKVLYSQLNI